jgi:hypothetical protein
MRVTVTDCPLFACQIVHYGVGLLKITMYKIILKNLYLRVPQIYVTTCNFLVQIGPDFRTVALFAQSHQ